MHFCIFLTRFTSILLSIDPSPILQLPLCQIVWSSSILSEAKYSVLLPEEAKWAWWPPDPTQNTLKKGSSALQQVFQVILLRTFMGRIQYNASGASGTQTSHICRFLHPWTISTGISRSYILCESLQVLRRASFEEVLQSSSEMGSHSHIHLSDSALTRHYDPIDPFPSSLTNLAASFRTSSNTPAFLSFFAHILPFAAAFAIPP